MHHSSFDQERKRSYGFRPVLLWSENHLEDNINIEEDKPVL